MSLRQTLLDAGYARAVKPYLFRVGGGDPERAHEDTIIGLRDAGHVPGMPQAVAALTAGPRAAVTVAGIEFPSVVGLAAGVDKDGLATAMWGALGLGHVELGTVTARPQPGNPSPRMFRLRESRAVINRMGFNNQGSAALARRLREDRARGRVTIPVGVSIGKTKTTPVEDAVGDYLTSVDALDGAADYLAVNVSSPNTPGLRSLQDAEPLRELLTAIVRRTRELASLHPGDEAVPVFVKLAPDLTFEAVEEAVGVATEAGVAGVIATNTTLARDGLALRDAVRGREAGGLSGAPLTARAREVVAFVRSRTQLPVIGVGGIMTADDAMAMLDAGADLLQVYTGFIYGGPGLVRAVNAAHEARLRAGNQPLRGRPHADSTS